MDIPVTTNFLVNLDEPTKKFFKEISPEHSVWLNPIFSAFLGAALAIVVGYILFLIQEFRKTKADELFEKNVLNAIFCEIKTLIELHDKGIGTALRLQPEGKPFIMFLHISQNFFSVFEANASHIGKINPILSKDIIELYLLMKAMIEDLAVNKIYNDQLTTLAKERKSLDRNSAEFNEVTASYRFCFDAMVGQAVRLKVNDLRIHNLAGSLMQKFAAIPVKKSLVTRLSKIFVRALRGI